MLGNAGLRFTQLAWLKIQWWLQCGSCETSFMGISDADDPMLVRDVYMPKHYATSAFVEFDDESLGAEQFKLHEKGIESDQCGRIWIHTHPGNSADPSTHDWTTFRRYFGKTDWSCMVIFARGGSTFAMLRAVTPSDYHKRQQQLAVEANIKVSVLGDMLENQSTAWLTIDQVPRDILAEHLPIQEWQETWDESCRPWSENPDQTTNTPIGKYYSGGLSDSPPIPHISSNHWVRTTRTYTIDNMRVNRVGIPVGMPNDLPKLMELYGIGIISKDLDVRDEAFQRMLQSITHPVRAKENAVAVWRFLERRAGIFADRPAQMPKKGRAPNSAGANADPYPIGTVESTEELDNILAFEWTPPDNKQQKLLVRSAWRLACRYALTYQEAENVLCWNNQAEYYDWLEVMEMEFGEYCPGFGMFSPAFQQALLKKWDKTTPKVPPRAPYIHNDTNLG